MRQLRNKLGDMEGKLAAIEDALNSRFDELYVQGQVNLSKLSEVVTEAEDRVIAAQQKAKDEILAAVNQKASVKQGRALAHQDKVRARPVARSLLSPVTIEATQ